MSVLNFNPITQTARYSNQERREQCLAIRRYFSSHYSAKPEEQEAILDIALALKHNDVIVELGVCNGQTAAMLARSTGFTGALYYGIDAYMLECSYENDEPPEIRNGIAQLHYLVERMSDLNLSGQLLFGKTQDIGRLWSSKREAIASHLEVPGSIFADGGISLLFIDAGHDEANIKPDIDIWLPLVKPGGIIVFHDYDNPYDPSSPHEAVRRNADLATHYGENAPGDDYGHTREWTRQIIGSMLIARKPLVELKDDIENGA